MLDNNSARKDLSESIYVACPQFIDISSEEYEIKFKLPSYNLTIEMFVQETGLINIPFLSENIKPFNITSIKYDDIILIHEIIESMNLIINEILLIGPFIAIETKYKQQPAQIIIERI
jgi:hypothetical protein